MNQGKIVIVDDDEVILSLLSRVLKRSYEVIALKDPIELLTTLVLDPEIDVVLTDLMMPGMDGIELCRQIKERRSDVEVLVMTGAGSIDVAVRAMQAGAYDFLTKPFDNIEIPDLAISKALERKKLVTRTKYLESEVNWSRRFENIIGASPKMKNVFNMIESVAKTDATVLISGESGTGKELVARAIHDKSNRANRTFVPLNCAALTETLLESELFGHAKGAFTGAAGARRGLFEEANHGTLFLDEIGEMPMGTQVKMLRALESGEIKAVGSNEVKKIDARIISATHLDFAKAIEENRFRNDLYYRINVITIEIPPLRERPEDIPLLTHHFIRMYASKTKKDVKGIDPAAMSALMAYRWPGNVRELAHVVERAVVLTKTDNLILSCLPQEVLDFKILNASLTHSFSFGVTYAEAKSEAISAFDRTYLADMLARAQGSISAAARIAGLDRSNFRRLLGKYDINPRVRQHSSEKT